MYWNASKLVLKIKKMVLLGYILGILIGTVLGLFGSGGAIISFPVLVYFMNIPAEQAGTYSLLIVGIAAGAGIIRQWKEKNIHFQSALFFAVPLLIGFYITKFYLLPLIPSELVHFSQWTLTKNHLIMALFIITLSYIIYNMLSESNNTTTIPTSSTNTSSSNISLSHWLSHWLHFILTTLLVGILSASIGAGGGFIIVPALINLFKLPIKKATSTSLFIIFLNALIGTILNHSDFSNEHISVLVTFSIMAIIGIIIGTYLNTVISAIQLKKSYAYFLLFILTSTIFSEIYKTIHP